MILDSTCSEKRLFPANADIRMDMRRNARPDIVASACALPFKDACFTEIYCDPPHRVGRQFGFDKTESKQAEGYARFLFWKNISQWLKFLVQVDREFNRCLKPDGKIIFKIPDGKRSKSTMIDVDHLKYLQNFVITNNERKESTGFFAKANIKKGKGKSFIHYVTLQKKVLESKKIWRSVKLQAKKHRKEFIVDTLFGSFFWLVVHVLKDVFIVQMELWQVALAAISGTILNLALSGVYGQCLNWMRKKTHVK